MGVLTGIARHGRPKAPMETVERVIVTQQHGIAGDYRGAMRGGPYRRQVTLIEREGWDAAMSQVVRALPWEARRSNLLVEGIDLPKLRGSRLRIGSDVILEVTCETDPCERMEALARGLRAALTPDWRGGVCAFVVRGGTIAVGDTVTFEDPE